MKVFCRVKAVFQNPANRGEKHIVEPLAFDYSAPDWIRKDPLFDLLVKDGAIEVIESVAQQKQLENEPGKKTDTKGKKQPAKKEAEPKQPPAGEGEGK